MSSPNSHNQAAQPASEVPKKDNSREQGQIPANILQQADNAAAAASSDGFQSQSDLISQPPIEDVPPPPYSAEQYGEIDIHEKGMDTGAKVAEDGRVDIKISSKNRRLTTLLRHQLDQAVYEPAPEPEIPEGLGLVSGLPPPPMNVVIQIVGSRGDVQPFVALGQVLKNQFNHRVRIATHPVFKDFITENGLEFFSIGGDPAELMAFMVKNPGLMPGIEAIKSGDIGKRRKGIYEMINGCWRSCIEPGDGTGRPASDDLLDGQSFDSGVSMGDPSAKPFVADAIIANPPSFAHLHIAEKLGVPLHLMFTMPWSPTQSFPHPLANIVSSNADAAMTNFLSYILVDLLTWQGIGDVINRFREKALGLEPLSIIWAPGNLHRLKIPWTYCWSPALIPKPGDWQGNIDISGFYFLNLATNYTPPPDLDEFLNAGPPPVYIGFGSIVVDDPNAMTKLIFEAVKKTGQRALVSKGWGGLSGDEMGVPEGVFMLGNCPHDWLFKKVSCVVHHGGAGTTAAGIAAGRPTIIVPFFGDQPFWGQMCHRAGAGPEPIHHKQLTADKLADAIKYALKPDVLDRAKEMSDKIKQEKGSDAGAESFHRHLTMSKLRCSICPGRVAVWQYKKSGVRLSALAATVLANEGLLDFADLRLYRTREYMPDNGPPEPISGGAAALVGSIGSVAAGVADYPSEIWKSFKKGSHEPEEGGSESSAASVSSSTSAGPSNSSRTASSSVVTPSESSSVKRKPVSSTAILTVTNTNDGQRSESPSSISHDASETPLTPSSMSTTSLRPEVNPRQSRKSESSSPQSQGSRTPKGSDRSPSYGRAQQVTMDSMIGSAKATGNIVAAGMKSPLDFTMSIAQGFHNAPKLYGDKTVRPTEKVTGFHSGLRAAGKEFGYGFYDGITGLVQQPLQGAKEEGFAGFGKGLIKGSLGLVLKPGAAIWGLPGYTMKGVYAEIVKNFGKSTTNFIIAARTAQGYEDWKASSEGDRERIVATWKTDIVRTQINGKKKGGKQKASTSDSSRFYDDQGQLLTGFKATRHLSYDDRRELSRLKKELRESKPKEPLARTSNTSSPASESALLGTNDDEFEQAIRTAVQKTSHNDPEEDARIERAIRASVKEFQRKMSAGPGQSSGTEGEDEAYDRAIAASVAEYQRTSTQSTDHGTTTFETTLRTQSDEENFTRALQASLEESRRPGREESPGFDTEDDEDYRKAIAESRKGHSSGSQLRPGSNIPSVQVEPPPAYESRSELPASPAAVRGQSRAQHETGPDLPPRRSGDLRQSADNDADDEEEFNRALKASEDEAKQREKERNEEDIVLEYVKKQSLAEEEYRKKRQGQ